MDINSNLMGKFFFLLASNTVSERCGTPTPKFGHLCVRESAVYITDFHSIGWNLREAHIPTYDNITTVWFLHLYVCLCECEQLMQKRLGGLSFPVVQKEFWQKLHARTCLHLFQWFWTPGKGKAHRF